MPRRRARKASISLSGFAQEILAVKGDAPAVITPGGMGIKRGTDRAVIDLPQPVSPTSPQHIAAAASLGRRRQHFGHAVIGVKFEVQVFDVQQFGHAVSTAAPGSRISRKPSPIRFQLKSISQIASRGRWRSTIRPGSSGGRR